ncbi:MAG: hypothetical protein KF773_02640 [Deltaproteobacteria bacterium]|nr:hypothetical protein [Deltaproteobacteria bacterium]
MRWLLATAAVLVVAAGAARAESKEADALFEKGKKQLAAKKYADACATFEKVDQLDPGIGAKLNVARCYEEWGKLAQAWRWYTDAETMAAASSDKRSEKIRELVDAIDADVPRITIKVAEGADGAAGKVTLDGVPVKELGVEQRVDPGPHTLEFTSSTGERKKREVPLERGGSAEVTLDLPKKVAKPPGGGGGGDGTGPRKQIGLVAGGAGIVALGFATYLGLDARGNYNEALADRCAGDPARCDTAGLRWTTNARAQANHATIFAIAGAALVGTGVYLYVTAPKKSEPFVKLSLAPADGGGLVVGFGRF